MSYQIHNIKINICIAWGRFSTLVFLTRSLGKPSHHRLPNTAFSQRNMVLISGETTQNVLRNQMVKKWGVGGRGAGRAAVASLLHPKDSRTRTLLSPRCQPATCHSLTSGRRPTVDEACGPFHHRGQAQLPFRPQTLSSISILSFSTCPDFYWAFEFFF